MGKYKDEHGETRASKFLKGISGVAPSLLQLAATVTGVDGLKDLANAIKKDPTVSDSDTGTALELLQLDLQEEKELTKRWELDMKSDSWMSKNIRPLVVANFTLLIDIVIISSMWGKPLGEAYLPLLLTMGMTVIGGYFTLREYGKNKKE